MQFDTIVYLKARPSIYTGQGLCEAMYEVSIVKKYLDSPNESVMSEEPIILRKRVLSMCASA